MDNETWAPLPDAPGYYVSTAGRLASNARFGWRILKPAPNRDGYLAFPLTIAGIRKNFRLHRLIARAFLPPPPSPKHEINHIDGVKANCAPSNLAWVTKSENHRHRVAVLGINPLLGHLKHGEDRPDHKLTDDSVRSIRSRFAAGERQRALSSEFGVSQVCISHIVTRKAWKHVL